MQAHVRLSNAIDHPVGGVLLGHLKSKQLQLWVKKLSKFMQFVRVSLNKWNQFSNADCLLPTPPHVLSCICICTSIQALHLHSVGVSGAQLKNTPPLLENALKARQLAVPTCAKTLHLRIRRTRTPRSIRLSGKMSQSVLSCACSRTARTAQWRFQNLSANRRQGAHLCNSDVCFKGQVEVSRKLQNLVHRNRKATQICTRTSTAIVGRAARLASTKSVAQKAGWGRSSRQQRKHIGGLAE